MTSAEVWASLALATMLGFAAFLVAFARALLPQASAFSVLEKTDERMDSRISALLERIRNREQKKEPTQPLAPQQRTDPLAQIFGGAPLETSPILEQPDAEPGLEVVEP